MSEPDRLEELSDSEEAWSPSRLKTAGTCGKSYDFKYNEKAPVESQDNLKFGTAIHAAIYRIHQEGAWDLARWRRVWEEEWQDKNRPPLSKWADGNKKILDYDKLGPKILMKYVSNSDNKSAIVMNAEWEFPNGRERYFVGDHEIKGIVDQIRLIDGRIAVVDFKTSQREPDVMVLRHDVQFTSYYKVALEKYGEEPLLFWAHLRNGKMIETKRNAGDVAELAVLLAEGKERVKQKMFAKNFGYHCSWCSFKLRCLGTA